MQEVVQAIEDEEKKELRREVRQLQRPYDNPHLLHFIVRTFVNRN